MTSSRKTALYFGIIVLLFIIVGQTQSWNLALSIMNLCLIASVMALGVNIQWGYAGLFSVGTMGFVAIGGLAAVLVAQQPVEGAWDAAGNGLWVGLGIVVATTIAATFAYRKMPKGSMRMFVVASLVVFGYILIRIFFDPVTHAIEKFEPATSGYLGGLGLPVLLAWPIGGALAGGVAWVIGKITLGLRSDYLAIATLGISEIIVAILKHEDWMSRGVMNVTGVPRPVPYETDLQQADWFQSLAATLGADVVTFSSIFVKLCYASLFTAVLLIILVLSEKALKSPWGRMMRAIRDNETSANAMGKNVTARHLQVFVIGSIVIGIAGAMMTTQDGLLNPGTYQPLRFTFLIWVMVIVGGSGNNIGVVLGAFIIGFFWIQVETLGPSILQGLTFAMAEDSELRKHLIGSAAHMRLMTMGIILLLVLRFRPRGLLPER